MSSDIFPIDIRCITEPDFLTKAREQHIPFFGASADSIAIRFHHIMKAYKSCVFCKVANNNSWQLAMKDESKTKQDYSGNGESMGCKVNICPNLRNFTVYYVIYCLDEDEDI